MNPVNPEHSPHPEFDLVCLIDAAAQMDQARKEGDKSLLTAAIDHNRVMWTGIHSLSIRTDCPFPEEKCGELIRLSDYVWSATKSQGADITDTVLDTLINIDMQVSEELLHRDKH